MFQDKVNIISLLSAIVRPTNLHLTVAHSKGQGHVHFNWENLENCDKYGKHYYFRHRKSYVAFWLAYLYLILAHSKGQGQGM